MVDFDVEVGVEVDVVDGGMMDEPGREDDESREFDFELRSLP